jgi:hypothetical protein
MSETLDPVAINVDQKQLAEQLLAQAKNKAWNWWAQTACSIN